MIKISCKQSNMCRNIHTFYIRLWNALGSQTKIVQMHMSVISVLQWVYWRC